MPAVFLESRVRNAQALPTFYHTRDVQMLVVLVTPGPGVRGSFPWASTTSHGLWRRRRQFTRCSSFRPTISDTEDLLQTSRRFLTCILRSAAHETRTAVVR